MIGELHLIVGVITFFAIAIILSIFMVEKPTAKPMSTSEQYIRNLRNLMFNISFFAFCGWVIGFSFELLIIFIGGRIPQSNYLDAIWVLISVSIWLLWPQKLLYVPTTNSVFRTSNRIFTEKRKLPDDQGWVDNAVKYHGPIFAIINIFDQSQGVFDTESQESLEIPMKQLTFSDDVGAAKIILNYAIDDTDAYAAGGADETLRQKKIRQTTEAYLRNMVEARSSAKEIRETMKNPKAVFGDISEEFRREAHEMEVRLGIRVQGVKVTDINESDEHRKALATVGSTNSLMKQAEKLVEISNEDITIKEAMKIVSATAGKIKYTVIDTPKGEPLPRNVLVTENGDNPLSE